MFEPVFQSFEKLIIEFSWRRLVFLLLLLTLAGVCIWIWESNTGQMRLTRIEKTISILSSIKELQENKTIQSDPTLSAVLISLKDELRAFTEKKSEAPIITPFLSKALAGSSPWLLFAFFFLATTKARKEEDIMGLIGCIFLASGFGAIGGWLPDFPYPWINYIGFPIATFVLIIALTLWWQSRQRARMNSGSS